MTKPGTARVVFAWATIFCLGLIPPLLRELHPDTAWLLYLAERMLAGERQGVDFLEVNPPLAIWLMLPAAISAQVTGVALKVFWVLTVGTCAGAALFLLARILTSVLPELGDRRRFLLLSGIVFLVLPRLEFGEREQLAVVFSLPFVVLTGSRIAGRGVAWGVAVLAGLLGGIGFSLKPQFLVVWLSLEAYLIARLRWQTTRRPELHSLVGFGILYAALVLVLVPEYVPMAQRLAPIYNAYLNNGWLITLLLGGPLLFLLTTAVLISLLTAKDRPLRDTIALTFLGFLFVAVQQQKGFSYHYLAAWSYGILVLGVVWLGRPKELSWNPSSVVARTAFALTVVLSALALIDAAREVVQPRNPKYRFDANFATLLPVVRELAGHEPVAVLSSNPKSAWPLILEAEVAWPFRYMSQWPLAALYDDQLWASPPRVVSPRPFGQRTGFEREFTREVIQDLTRRMPRLLVVLTPDSAQAGWGGARRIDYVGYFGSDPRFRAFMLKYGLVRKVGPYQLWLRNQS